MIRNNTVFVLGAGASWHYGYPTGEDLVGAIIKMAAKLEGYCRFRCTESMTNHLRMALPQYVEARFDDKFGATGALSAWESVAEECRLIRERLTKVKPILIDHFLAWNESLRRIGKFLIAAVILECEAKWIRFGRNSNRLPDDNSKDHWYRFLIHKLVYACKESSDIFQNNVKFITFNYDVSLERILYEAIGSMDLLLPDDVYKFITTQRIIHVYGAVHENILAIDARIDVDVVGAFGDRTEDLLVGPTSLNARKTLLDQCYVSAQLLRTVDPHDKEDNYEVLNTAQKWISEAGIVYILGYGFDDSNNKRIGLDALRHDRHNAAVMFTNYSNLNVINKKASKLFFGQPSSFLDGYINGDATQGFYAEKSVRNVYDALNMDFNAMENELTATTKI